MPAVKPDEAKARKQAALRRRVLGLAMRFVLPGAMWVALGALLLRLTVRDRWSQLDLLYYATPPFVIAGLGFVAGLAAWRQRRLWHAVVGGALAVVGAGLGLSSQYAWHAPRAAERPIRICEWNVARGVGGWDALAKTIRRMDPDIVALVEAGISVPAQAAMWREALPGYESSRILAGTILLARGKVEPLASGAQRWVAAYQVSRVTIDGRSLIVVLVDVSSSFIAMRARALAAIREVLEPYGGEPVVLLGDFNTPPDSCWFDPLRETMSNAFESAGYGYMATWPSVLPLLPLDQIWTQGIQPASCRVEFAWRSDHRPIVATIDWASLPVGPGGAP